jgi:hypothetical protein
MPGHVATSLNLDDGDVTGIDEVALGGLAST